MKRVSPLLGLSVGLDLVGVLLGALLAAHLLHHNPAPALQADGLAFGMGFLLLAWFLGGYSFLRWPWIPYRQLVQRWLLVVGVALALAVLTGWFLNAASSAVWLHHSTLLIVGVVTGVWGSLLRLCLQPLAANRMAVSEVTRLCSRSPASIPSGEFPKERQLLLMFVAYHTSSWEVDQLEVCLSALPPEVGYAVVVNDYQQGEPIERLADGADCFLANSDNPGYGRAVNLLAVRLTHLPPYIGVLNTDISWCTGTFEKLLGWLHKHPQVSLAVPQILDEAGTLQKLCKHNPTLLGLFSRRFMPDWLKPLWLKHYDRWYVMADQNYQEAFEAPYLSGCCMLIKSDAFIRVGGFDERYFLYLEDADITRSLARHGRCLHLPVGAVIHAWGRGNYRKLGLLIVNLISAWNYFRKWGWSLW